MMTEKAGIKTKVYEINLDRMTNLRKAQDG